MASRFTLQDLQTMKSWYEEGLSAHEISRRFNAKLGKPTHHTTILYHLGRLSSHSRPETKRFSDGAILNYPVIQQITVRVRPKKAKPESHYFVALQRSMSVKLIRDDKGMVIGEQRIDVCQADVKREIRRSMKIGMITEGAILESVKLP